MVQVLTLNDTGPLKRDLIEAAFESWGSAGYEFERSPEEVNSALRKLNAMMWQWPWDRLDYVQPTYGAGKPEEYSGIPPWAAQAVSDNLCLLIAPANAATLSREQGVAASRSLTYVQGRVSVIPPALFRPHTPRGSGAIRYQRSPFINEVYPTETAPIVTIAVAPAVPTLVVPGMAFNLAANSQYIGSLVFRGF
jgi:hypothetical protein